MKPISTLRFVADPWRYPIVPAKSADEGVAFGGLLVGGDRVLSMMA